MAGKSREQQSPAPSESGAPGASLPPPPVSASRPASRRRDAPEQAAEPPSFVGPAAEPGPFGAPPEPVRQVELSPDSIQTRPLAAPSGSDPTLPASAFPELPPAAPLPSLDEDSYDGDLGEVTVVTTITDEIRALQKGYRKTSPLEALHKQLGRYDDSAEIEILSEAWLDGLLVEEILTDEAPSAEPKIRVEAYGLTDRGLKRTRNEDALLLMSEANVYLVADGMGGHAAGEVAAQTAVEITERAFGGGVIYGVPNVFWPVLGDELARTVEMSNAEVFRMAGADAARTGMGTTLTALRISLSRQRAYIAHVGDSRCYRMRAGELVRLTTDHTVGQLFGVKGPMSAHLCRAVGIEPSVEVDLLVDLPEPGDLYLLCSDGLTKMVKERRLYDYLLPERDLPEIATSLVEGAKERGGVDNVTVLLIRIHAL